MKNLSDLATIKKLLTRHGFQFSKALGQNFLIDPSVCPRMAQECGVNAQSGVLEIGPGFGVLTQELAARAKKVVAVELDHRLPAVLAETLEGFENVTVLNEDVLKLDLPALIREQFPDMPVFVCANLPYYITSPVIMKLLEERLPVQSITVMVQKEAAVRICAQPGKRQCGAVSVAVQYYAQPDLLFDVPRDSFYPAPNVDSAVIRLTVRDSPPIELGNAREGDFFRLIRAAFGQRRKTILNALSGGLQMEKACLTKCLEQSKIPTNARAEQLTMEQFGTLCRTLFQEEP